MIDIIALIILSLFGLVGFIFIFFSNFGTLIIFLGSIVYAIMTRFAVIGVQTLIILCICYIIGEAIEYLGVILGAKKFGASKRAILGALLGGIAGGFLGVTLLGVGVFLGTFLGIFCGAFLAEFTHDRDWRRSLASGTGGVLGRLLAIGGKVIIALLMFLFMVNRILFCSPVFSGQEYRCTHTHHHHEK